MLTAILLVAASSGLVHDCREGSCYWPTQVEWPVDAPEAALCERNDGSVLAMGEIDDDGSLFSALALEYVAARQNQPCAAWDGVADPIASGLTSFFDPNDPSGVVLDASGKVVTLVNLAPTAGRDLTQTSSTRRPALVDDGGVNVMQFTGREWLVSTADVQGYIPGSGWTIVVEVKPTALPNRDTSYSPWATNGIAGAFSDLDVGVSLRKNGTSVEANAWHVGAYRGWDPSEAHSGGPAVGVWSVLAGELGHNGPPITIAVDDGAPVLGRQASDHTATGPFSVGRVDTGGTGYLTGRVGRVLTYSRALTPEELAATRAFFAGGGTAPAAKRAQAILADCVVDAAEVDAANAALGVLVDYNDAGDTGGQCSAAPVCGDGVVNGALEECDDGNTAGGDGCNAACVLEACGDGVVNNGGVEECDDGNTLANDGCGPTCAIETCGDGVVNNGAEECDDGNAVGGDGCDGNCKVERCGDGIFNNDGTEECDDGVHNAVASYCSPTCRVQFCGDGTVNGFWGEECDDGNFAYGDGCDGNCRVERCGDGIVNNNGTEECDEGVHNAVASYCSPTCRVQFCGDGTVNGLWDEECDDGNFASGDGCDGNCKTERCGDGIINNNDTEECDEGVHNAVASYCSPTCRVQFCGDGTVNGVWGEECDDGNVVFGDGCDGYCRVERCGDGIVNDGGTEECDDGNLADGDGCSASCVRERCGDGLVNDNGEECDDGNAVDGDGCGHGCRLERCGDGVVNNSGVEECDDGNQASADGCSATCLVETGFVCVGDPSGCTAICGDGLVRGAEECDDGTNCSGGGAGACNDDDTPDACRVDCRIPFCGDGVVDSASGEECDPGSDSDDACSSDCRRLWDDRFWITNGRLNAVAETESTIIVGGQFDYVGPRVGGLAVVDDAAGAVLNTLSSAQIDVEALAPDGMGGWFVGGAFSRLLGAPRDTLAHLLPDGTLAAWHPTFTARPQSGAPSVLSIAVTDDVVYIGGQFISVNGAARSSLAAFDAATGELLPWNPGGDATNISAVRVQGATLYVFGHFTTIGGAPRSNVAALDAQTGLATAFNMAARNGHVDCIEPAGDVVFVGGTFTTIGGEAHPYVAALDATDGHATPWQATVYNPVGQLATSGTSLFASTDANLYAVDVTSGAWRWVRGLGFGASPNALLPMGSSLYVAARVDRSYYPGHRGLVAFDIDTGAQKPWRPFVDQPGRVLALAADGAGGIAVGGDFYSIGGVERCGIAALDRGTGAATPFVMGEPTNGCLYPNEAITSLSLTDDAVVVGGPFLGAFDAVTGAKRWVRYTGGQVVDSNRPPIAASITVGGNVFVGGDFASIYPDPRDNLAAFDATTGELLAWDPGADGPVSALADAGGALFVGGSFRMLGGSDRPGIGEIETTTGLVTSWTPHPFVEVSGAVNAIFVDGARVLAAGSVRFHLDDVSAQGGLAAFDRESGEMLPAPSQDDIYAMARVGENLIVGGESSPFGFDGLPLRTLTVVDDDWHPLSSPFLFGTVRALVATPDGVIIGGFLGIDGYIATVTELRVP